MGIIINEEYQDDRGVKITGCYGSFSRKINIVKINFKQKKEISKEDASGNVNALKEQSYTYDNSNNQIDNSKYFILEDNHRYSVYSEFTIYVSKDIRKNSESIKYPQFNNLSNEDRRKMYSSRHQCLKVISVSIDIDMNELGNVFSKLYEKVKSDKTLFPYTNISDDL
tara:strand:+ start:310 stop:813 length:504 start_codon:yes stop_codon:yes gene_type:complete